MTTRRLRSHFPPAVLLLLSLAFARSARAQVKSTNPAPLDLAGYVAQLDRCAAAVRGLQRNPSGIYHFRESLPGQWEVRTGGKTFRVSTYWLDFSLAKIQSQPGKDAKQWHEIRDRLEFLREQAAALASPAAAPSAAVATRKLDAIFQQSEFRGLEGPSPLQRWWRRWTLTINRWIGGLFARLHLGILSSNVVAYGLIAAALIFLLFWGWRALAGRTRLTEMSVRSAPRAVGARAWAADARAAAQRGDFREAVRCAYWAAVAHMEEQRTLLPDRSHTPRELLRMVAPEAREREPFRELTRSFELVWYGYDTPSPADWENTKLQLEKIGCLGVSTPQTARS